MRASVWREDHVKLSSGLHSEIKLDMERLSGFAREFSIVMAGLRRELESRDLKVFAAADRGARVMMSDVLYPPEFFVIDNRKVKGVESKRFTLKLDSYTRRFLQATDDLAIIDDVVTTGGTPAALADAIHEVNPSARLHLFGVWRRGELYPEFSKPFVSQTFLVEEEIPAWPLENCLNCPLGTES